MCWNENISLNTFLFSSASLLFIYYASTYTPYKLPEFVNNPYLYLLCLSFIVMQGIEFFLWKSIHTKNKPMNQVFSFLGWSLIFIAQPIALAMFLAHQFPKLFIERWLLVYAAVFLLIFGYKWVYNTLAFRTTATSTGHLFWNWNILNGAENIILVFYFAFALSVFAALPWFTAYVFFLLFLCNILYTGSISTMWCWVINSVMLLFLVKILFVLPFREYRYIC